MNKKIIFIVLIIFIITFMATYCSQKVVNSVEKLSTTKTLQTKTHVTTIDSPFVTITSKGTTQQEDDSGFYVASNLVITCKHVLKFNNITVNGGYASVVSRNASKDIAILKVSRLTNFPLKLSTKLKQGEPITIMSNPLGLENTLSSGIISNTRRVN